MSTCGTCGAVVTPGALMCPSCGVPVVSVSPGSGPAAVLPFAPVASSPRAGSAHALAPVAQGAVEHARAIALPGGDFTMLLGRHDLSTAPPTVVDIDLTSVCGPVALPDGSRGFPFSRRHATLSRVAGALTLTPCASGTTLVRRPGETDFAPLAGSTSRVLDVGSRVVFGAHQPLIVEVI
ncbi:MAG: hypothetical protein WCJ30_12615 [Deltaproteobacteria bacterium]